MIEGVQGPMARSVTDCALFLDNMVSFDARQPISFTPPKVAYFTAVQKPKTQPRIAFTPDLNGFAPVDKEVSDHLAKTMKTLAKNGAKIEEAAPDISKLHDTYHTLRGMMWATGNKLHSQNVRQHFKETLLENIAFGEALTMSDIADAQINRSHIFANMNAIFKNHDVLALPTVGCMPHPQSEEWVSEVGGQKLAGYMDWLSFAFLATVCGLPAISVPVGLGPRGLPVGLQMIGKPRGEAELLRVARFVEQSVGGPLGPIDPVVN